MNGAALLLQLIAVNGGSMPVGKIQEWLRELEAKGLLKVTFETKSVPKTIRAHTTYTWELTDKGRKLITEKQPRGE